MAKDPLFTGQPIFTQLLSLLDRSRISELARQFQSDRYYKRFRTYDHLVTMLYATFHKCTSLREVTTGMQACAGRLHHVGISYSPRRSTLSDANRDRPAAVFAAIYQDLYRTIKRHLPDSREDRSWYKKLYIVDATTISLFKEILKNAGRPTVNGKRKGGIKVHTLIKADEDVPCLIRMSAATLHDVSFIRGLTLPRGSIVTFDRGYVDYRQFDRWTRRDVFWVTRIKKRSTYEVVRQHAVDADECALGVRSDTQVLLGHPNQSHATRPSARLIDFIDPKSGETFEFITNHPRLPPSAIALIYQHRWQIELLFKRIKQNYPLNYFLGDNENAIRIQIWCALIADLLLKFVRSKITKRWSFSNLASMVRIHLMTYIHLFKFLENPDSALILHTTTIRNKGPSLFD